MESQKIKTILEEAFADGRSLEILESYREADLSYLTRVRKSMEDGQTHVKEMAKMKKTLGRLKKAVCVCNTVIFFGATYILLSFGFALWVKVEKTNRRTTEPEASARASGGVEEK